MLTAQKKIISTYCTWLVLSQDFQQQEWLNYNILAISSPVTSDAAIFMVLIMMAFAGYNARVFYAQVAFLGGELKNNEQIYIQKYLRHSTPNKLHGWKSRSLLIYWSSQ